MREMRPEGWYGMARRSADGRRPRIWLPYQFPSSSHRHGSRRGAIVAYPTRLRWRSAYVIEGQEIKIWPQREALVSIALPIYPAAQTKHPRLIISRKNASGRVAILCCVPKRMVSCGGFRSAALQRAHREAMSNQFCASLALAVQLLCAMARTSRGDRPCRR
jgi:hypothetical protein